MRICDTRFENFCVYTRTMSLFERTCRRKCSLISFFFSSSSHWIFSLSRFCLNFHYLFNALLPFSYFTFWKNEQHFVRETFQINNTTLQGVTKELTIWICFFFFLCFDFDGKNASLGTKYFVSSHFLTQTDFLICSCKHQYSVAKCHWFYLFFNFRPKPNPTLWLQFELFWF